jgi:hypothetical protein
MREMIGIDLTSNENGSENEGESKTGDELVMGTQAGV